MFRVEVIADNSGVWAGNGIRYDVVTDAVDAARDLHSRWMLVRQWRVIDNNDVVHAVST